MNVLSFATQQLMKYFRQVASFIDKNATKKKHYFTLWCNTELLISATFILVTFCRAQVTLTDLPEALSLLRLNINENKKKISSMGGYAIAESLVWGDNSSELVKEVFDTVVLADCIYYEEVSKNTTPTNGKMQCRTVEPMDQWHCDACRNYLLLVLSNWVLTPIRWLQIPVP